MKLDKGMITGRQLMLTLLCFLQASALLTSFLSVVTRNDSWIVTVLAAVCFIPVAFIYRGLIYAFPGMNLMQMLVRGFGPAAGKTLGALYVWFLFTLTSLNLKDLSDFSKLTLMPQTPAVVLTALCLLVAAIAVRRGIVLVVRYSALFSVVALVILSVSTLFLIGQMEFKNLLPPFQLPVLKYVQGTHIVLTIPFSESVAFLMIAPNFRLSREDYTRRFFQGFFFGTLVFLTVVVRDIAVLGNTLEMLTLPSLVTLRLVNLGPTLSRMEILFAVVLISLLFFKIMFLYYTSVIAMAQLFDLTSYRGLVLAAGAFMLTYAYSLYPTSVAHAASGRQVVPILWTFFEILVPLALLTAAKLRGLPKPAEGAA